MKVLKSSTNKIYNLKDFFIKELQTEPSNADIENEKKIDDNRFRVFCDVIGNAIKVVVSVFNENAGVDLGIREYIINFDDLKEKTQIRIQPVVLGSIIELLQQEGVGFKHLGEGIVSDWIQSDNDDYIVKIWISNDMDFMSITKKEIEQKEKQISKEEILDKLGL